MKYLIETTEVYRVDSEDECLEIVEAAKRSSFVKKYSSVKKEKKMKGEVVDTWYKLTITKGWTDEKDPDSSIRVEYKVEGGFDDED